MDKKYCRLEPPETEDDLVHGMEETREILHSYHSATSVLLSIGETSEDTLKELDKNIVCLQSTLKTKNLVQLLPFPSWKYYKFEVITSPLVLLLPHCNTDLASMKMYTATIFQVKCHLHLF